MKRDFSVHIAAITLFLTLSIPIRAAAQEYTVRDLGPADDWTGGVNNKSLVDGTALQPDGTDNAFVWRKGTAINLGTFGGPNSVAFKKPSESGLVVGKAETSNSDPHGEDFCMFGTQLICLPFVWQNGVKIPLPTLGGNNGIAFGVNNRSQKAGMVENATQNPTCPSTPLNMAPLEAKAVIWDGKNGVHKLPTYPGDTDSAVISINDYGQAVGVSTDCINSPSFLRNVLWKDRTVIDLGNLGGTYNEANNINNLGQVVGLSGASDTSFHGFLWTEDNGMLDLGTLPGDTISFAHANNDKGWIVGASCTADFDCSAVIWRDGQITDLNNLIPADSHFSLVEAFDINSRGEILSFGAVGEETHDYLLIPTNHDPNGNVAQANNLNQVQTRVLPERVRELLRRNAHSLAHIPSPSDAQSGIGAVSTTVTLSRTSLSFACGWSPVLGWHWYCSPPQTVSLTNTGSATLYITKMTTTGPFSQTNKCGTTLGAKQSCSITVTEHLSAFCRSGTYSGVLAINDTASGSPQKVALALKVGICL